MWGCISQYPLNLNLHQIIMSYSIQKYWCCNDCTNHDDLQDIITDFFEEDVEHFLVTIRSLEPSPVKDVASVIKQPPSKRMSKDAFDVNVNDAIFTLFGGFHTKDQYCIERAELQIHESGQNEDRRLSLEVIAETGSKSAFEFCKLSTSSYVS